MYPTMKEFYCDACDRMKIVTTISYDKNGLWKEPKCPDCGEKLRYREIWIVGKNKGKPVKY